MQGRGQQKGRGRMMRNMSRTLTIGASGLGKDKERMARAGIVVLGVRKAGRSKDVMAMMIGAKIVAMIVARIAAKNVVRRDEMIGPLGSRRGAVRQT
jgi:hypothetical protein